MTQTTTGGASRFFRIDRFGISATGRDELVRRIQQTHETLRDQPGYVRDYILERTRPADADEVQLLTFVEWDETTRPEAVRDAVRARHREDHFDPEEMYTRLRVVPDIGTYHATEAQVSRRDGSGVAGQQPSQRATGTYENDAAEELPFDDARDDASLRRATVVRRYSGDVSGSSIAHVTIYRATGDRLGYIATDQFEGVVDGRKGGFVFQHGGSIDRGVLRPFGYIVPGSGSAELTGISGEIEIAFTPPATHTIALTYRFDRR